MRRRLHLPRSLRSRLVAGLLVVAAIGLVTFGAITYAEQRSFLRERVEQQAASGSPAVIGAYNDQLRGGTSRRGPGGPPFSTLPSGSYGEIRQSDGTTALGDAVRFLPPGESSSTASTPKLPRKVTSGEKLIVPSANGGSDFYVAVRALRDFDSGSTFYVVTAVPLTDVDATLNRLLLIEGIVAAVVLLVLGALTWVLVRVGLRPLDRIAATAGSLAAGELDTRVEPAEPTTEVGRLGLALNGMLGRLEEAFAEREASEGRLRTFLADASHELRTPLAVLKGTLEVLVRKPRTQAEYELHIGLGIQEIDRLTHLVEQLLLLARFENHRRDHQPYPELSLLDCVHDALHRHRADVAAKHLRVDVTGAPDSTLRADPFLVSLVLDNVLSNAVKYSPAGSTIRVELARTTEHLVCSVADQGIGIAPADLDNIFQPLFRSNALAHKHISGNGLGLSIVAKACTLLGARLGVASELGRGSTFTLRFPLVAESQPAA